MARPGRPAARRASAFGARPFARIWISGPCLALAVIACGLKADPQPRDSVVPMPVADLSVRAEGGLMRVDFTLPDKSLDGSSLEAIGGYRLILGSPSGKEEERRDVRFSVTEQKRQVGRSVTVYQAPEEGSGTYTFWVLPLDAYGSHPEIGEGVPLVWEGQAPAAGQRDP
ncbi:MAG: hypothetical protein AB1640_01810 [bacterium]